MSENQIKFFQLLQEMHYKIMCFSHQCTLRQNIFRENGYSEIIENIFEDLEKELSLELTEISKKFFVSKRASMVLGAIIHLYVKHEGVRTNFITFGDIERFFYMDVELSLLIKLRESIFELQEKNIIEINDVEFYLVRVFNKSDRRENDYYMLPAKPSFVPFANKKFELSPSTINKLNNL